MLALVIMVKVMLMVEEEEEEERLGRSGDKMSGPLRLLPGFTGQLVKEKGTALS